MNKIQLISAATLLIFTTYAQSASVTYTVWNGSGTVFGTTLDRQFSIDSVFMRDNGQGEQHHINSLAISTLAIPTPPAIWLFGPGLVGLIVIARRKKAA